MSGGSGPPLGSVECGVMLIDKPAGVTSHDVVARVRNSLGRVKSGHTGTLDPFATGLLVVLLGRATRLQQYLLHLPKAYRAVARLGWTSDTADRDGILTETRRIPADPQIPVGEIDQQVPAYSAIKLDGKRLYQRARDGEVFEPPTRTIVVYRADRITLQDDRAVFEIECSSGTYIRSLVADLNDAYCDELVRTRIAGLQLEDADPDRILDPNFALSHLAERQLTDDEAARVITGIALEREDDGDDPVRLTYKGGLLAIAQPRDVRLSPRVVLASDLADFDKLLGAVR